MDRNSQPVLQSDTAKTPAAVVALSTTSGTVVPANPNRVEVTVCNPDASIVEWLALGPTAVAGSGIRLAAGEKYTTRAYTGVIAMLSASGTPNASYSEV